MGVGWHKFMPHWSVRIFGHVIELNERDVFNVKEHTIITIMTAAGASASYAIDILLAQEVFYNQFFRSVHSFLLSYFPPKQTANALTTAGDSRSCSSSLPRPWDSV